MPKRTQNPEGAAQVSAPLLSVAVGRSRFETKWKNKQLSWPELVGRLCKTTRTAETLEQYTKLPKDKQDKIKDVGAFVGGFILGGKRRKGSVAARQVLTLDLDHSVLEDGEGKQVKVGVKEVVDAVCDALFGFSWLIYSTHKHTPENPRLRLVMPLSREVDADEYAAIGRKVAEWVNIDFFDHTTFQPERLMYWPSTSVDGAFLCMLDGQVVSEGLDVDAVKIMAGGTGFEVGSRWLDADCVLGSYRDWRDMSSWPSTSAENWNKLTGMIGEDGTGAAKMADPCQKDGLVGAFCRAYGIVEAMEKFLDGVYEPLLGWGNGGGAGGQDDGAVERFTFCAGSTAGGALVYGNKFIYSHHSTDPAGGRLLNAFDLVRVHLFGLEDEGKRGKDVESGGKDAEKASTGLMLDLAGQDGPVRRQVALDRLAKAKNEFGDGSGVDYIIAGALEGGMDEDDGSEFTQRLEKKSAMKGTGSSDAANSAANKSEDEDGAPAPAPAPAPGNGGRDNESATDDAWTENLAVDKQGKIEVTMSNLELIMSNDPALMGALVWDTQTDRKMVVRDLPWRRAILRGDGLASGVGDEWRDVDYIKLRVYLERIWGMRVSVQMAVDAVQLGFDANKRNLLVEYLLECESQYVWAIECGLLGEDGVEGGVRDGGVFIKWLGAEDNAFVRAASRKALVAAVARAMRPATKFDQVLALVGGQGVGKSSLLARLGGKWFTDSIGAVGTKESYESIRGAWIVELAELAALRRSEVEAVKHFISKTADMYRPSYGREVIDQPRTCVFFASTNEEDGFLKDATGNRRWWPIRVEGATKTDKGGVALPSESEVAMLWGEAVTLWRKGERLYMDSAELQGEAVKAQGEHLEQDERETKILEFLDQDVPDTWDEMDTFDKQSWQGVSGLKLEYTTKAEIWEVVFGFKIGDMTQAKGNFIGDIMRKQKDWKRKLIKVKGKVFRAYVRKGSPWWGDKSLYPKD